jgi:hypothetical protein
MVTSQVVLKRQRITSALAIISTSGSKNLWVMIRSKREIYDYVDTLQDVYIIVVDVDTFPRGTPNNRQKKCPHNTENFSRHTRPSEQGKIECTQKRNLPGNLNTKKGFL